ncbi:cupin domain-containing protein [Lewinella sp. W8]|uniref:cupin domain-containing protein n=1 Tax=Lewinella sp. W8 TaxID=2528208 RepID=UPI0010684F33|nr:cupin domain-containing protein [Lewinella sp. W8]MTB50987.1 cupin domain-containing protein [Lewinella sp. W8]
MWQHPFYGPSEDQEYYFKERCHILEVINHPEAPAISLARARVEPGVTTVLHAVARTEVYYVLEGRGVARVGDQEYTLGQGQAAYISPGTPQQISNTEATDLVFLAICSPRFTPESYTDLGEK